MPTLEQIGKHFVDFGERHPAAERPDRGRQQQVFLAGKACENATLFGTVADPEVRHLEGGHIDRFGPMDLDGALARAGEAQYRAQRRGAPGAVAPEQRDDFALVHGQVDAVQDVRFAIPGVQPGDFECGGAHACAP